MTLWDSSTVMRPISRKGLWVEVSSRWLKVDHQALRNTKAWDPTLPTWCKSYPGISRRSSNLSIKRMGWLEITSEWRSMPLDGMDASLASYLWHKCKRLWWLSKRLCYQVTTSKWETITSRWKIIRARLLSLWSFFSKLTRCKKKWLCAPVPNSIHLVTARFSGVRQRTTLWSGEKFSSFWASLSQSS